MAVISPFALGRDGLLRGDTAAMLWAARAIHSAAADKAILPASRHRGGSVGSIVSADNKIPFDDAGHEARELMAAWPFLDGARHAPPIYALIRGFISAASPPAARCRADFDFYDGGYYR